MFVRILQTSKKLLFVRLQRSHWTSGSVGISLHLTLYTLIVGVPSQHQQPVALTLSPVVVSLSTLTPIFLFASLFVLTLVTCPLHKWRLLGKECKWGLLLCKKRKRRQREKRGHPHQPPRPSIKGCRRGKLTGRTTARPKRCPPVTSQAQKRVRQRTDDDVWPCHPGTRPSSSYT